MQIRREFTKILTEMCSFRWNMGLWVVTPHSNRLEKLTLLSEGIVQIRQEFTEILTKTCSFN